MENNVNVALQETTRDKMTRDMGQMNMNHNFPFILQWLNFIRVEKRTNSEVCHVTGVTAQSAYMTKCMLHLWCQAPFV